MLMIGTYAGGSAPAMPPARAPSRVGGEPPRPATAGGRAGVNGVEPDTGRGRGAGVDTRPPAGAGVHGQAASCLRWQVMQKRASGRIFSRS